MELEILVPSEVSQEDKYHVLSLNCGILKYGTNHSIYKTETDHSRKEQTVVAREEGEGVGWMGSLGLVDTNYYIWNG